MQHRIVPLLMGVVLGVGCVGLANAATVNLTWNSEIEIRTE